MADRLTTIRHQLEAVGQTHVLRFYDTLRADQQASLLDQLEAVDLEHLATLLNGAAAGFSLPEAIAPAPYYPSPLRDVEAYDAMRYRAAGERLLRGGKVAAFTVAGGQGTRLGWNGPKGTYPATVVTGKPLFRCFAEQLLAAQQKYGAIVPWYIMTSPANDADTRAFFLDNNCFGLLRSAIMMFPQGTLPSLGADDGRLLLADKHALAVNPDGHGGAFRALVESGATADMRRRGIDCLSYFQVDNPLVKAVDPLFVGLHVEAPDSSAEMSSKMVTKTDPAEKVGVFVSAGPPGARKTMVIEYSDLPAEFAERRAAEGRLEYDAGSIAIHLMSVEFIERVARDGGMPYHRALKKVAAVDAGGAVVEPDEANAIKLERFVFDALPLARASIVLETERVEEFAPIKNASGADSPFTSHQLQSDRAGRWLEAHGVGVERDQEGHVRARIEISPLTALEAADLVRVDLPERVLAGDELVL